MRHTLAIVLLAGCAGTSDSGTDPGGVPSNGHGAIFKGPLVEGSEVEWEMLDDNAVETGDEGETYVTNHLGDYELEMPSRGFIKVEAEGAFFDEATGGLKEVPIKLATYARVEPGQDVSVQINLLTDLIADRMLAELEAGVDYDEAQPALLAELHDALGIGVSDSAPQMPDQLSPWGDSDAQAYLLAVSAVLARAGEDLRLAGGGDIDVLLDDLRTDFAADGEIDADLQALIKQAEGNLDPDLATVSLQLLVKDLGESRQVPDLHRILDTDLDGIVNDDDNCPYVSNPDQAASAGSWGDACDDRFLSIDTTSGSGCGVRAVDGRIVCWQIDVPGFGGTAPRPDVKPTGAYTPWPSDEGLTGTYVHVSVDEYQICAVDTEGDLACWSPALGRFEVAGDFVRVEASRNRACAMDADGLATCVDPVGTVLVDELGPLRDLALVDGDQLLVADWEGTLAWVDLGAGLAGYALPDGAFIQVESGGERSVDQPWACALSESGAVACTGEHSLVDAAPAGDGYVDLAVGDGVACVQRDGEPAECWRAEDACPSLTDAPVGLTELTAEGCVTCGLDANGFGTCWPRKWYGERISYASF